MTKKLDGNVEQILQETSAKPGDIYSDDFGNNWLVHNDRDGLRLEIQGMSDAWIPYWTAMNIKLPGLHRV